MKASSLYIWDPVVWDQSISSPNVPASPWRRVRGSRLWLGLPPTDLLPYKVNEAGPGPGAGLDPPCSLISRSLSGCLTAPRHFPIWLFFYWTFRNLYIRNIRYSLLILKFQLNCKIEIFSVPPAGLTAPVCARCQKRPRQQKCPLCEEATGWPAAPAWHLHGASSAQSPPI